MPRVGRTVHRQGHQGETARKREGRWVLGSQEAQGSPHRTARDRLRWDWGADGLGWTRGTRILAPPAAALALNSSSAGGPSLHVPPLNHTPLPSRDQRCDYFIRPFVPTSRPGQFTLGNIKSES